MTSEEIIELALQCGIWIPLASGPEREQTIDNLRRFTALVAAAERAVVRHEADCVEACKSEIEALRAKLEALRAEVDALRLNAASVQPELVAVALAACDAVDDLIEKWYATRESGCLPNQVVRARGASKLLRAIALEGTK